MRAYSESPRRVWSAGFTYSWMSTMRSRRIPTDSAFIVAPEDAHSFVQQPRHVPVMVEEILRDLRLKPGSVVVDGTLGLGGHALRMIEAIKPGGTLVGMDWDAQMLDLARKRLGSPEGVRLYLYHEDFRHVKSVLDLLGLRADAMILDLGLNTAQIQAPERGFSFNDEGPLDMRMDQSKGEPAAALLNRLAPAQIEEALQEFGDERWARAIAKTIVETRKARPLKTTADLVACVLAAIPPKARDKRIHPATRTFQAIRVMVNREFEGLDQAVRDAASALAPLGTLSVLSYHSGEDRIVKGAFRELSEQGFEELHKKPLQPAHDEIARNPRSRSAKLRSLRRLS